MPDLRLAGAENVLKLMINTLIDKYPQYSIELCLASARGKLINEIDQRIRVVNFSRTNVRYCLFDLINYFRRNQPTCFISLLDYSNIIASFAHKLSRSRSKLILWEHSLTSIHSRVTISKFRVIRYFLINISYKHASKIIAVSNAICKDLCLTFDIPEEKIDVIYNPINIDNINRLAKQKHINIPRVLNGEKYILSVGRLVEAKNFQLLIRAYKYFSEYSSYKLLIVGDGSERLILDNLISELNLESAVIMVGHVENPYPLMKNAKLIVSSSNWEGLPLVLLEALALRKNIVATECKSGAREILDNGKYGLLVPVNDPERLAKGMLKIIKGNAQFDEDLLGERAKYFSIEKSFIKFMKIIH